MTAVAAGQRRWANPSGRTRVARLGGDGVGPLVGGGEASGRCWDTTSGGVGDEAGARARPARGQVTGGGAARLLARDR